MVKLSTSVAGVYAYSRPYTSQNGIVVANLDGVPAAVTVTLQSTGGPTPLLGITDGKKYYVSDLYNMTVDSVVFTSGTASLSLNLPAFGSAVFVVDTVARSLVLPPLTGVNEDVNAPLPASVSLEQNYPNPFNPATLIRYSIAAGGENGVGSKEVKLVVYDLLGREVAVLVNERKAPGSYSVRFDAGGLASGVYLYRLQAGDFVSTKRMLVLK